MRIDGFSHVLPDEYRQAMWNLRSGTFDLSELWTRVEALSNMHLRVEAMDASGVDKQVLTLAIPPFEYLVAGDDSDHMSRLANEGIARIVGEHADRFIGVGALSLLEPDRALKELAYAIEELGLAGILLYSNIGGRPLDSPDFEEFYSAVESYGVPIWIHPFRPEGWADYPTEARSEYLIWYSLGWPMDTTIAMARLVFGGVLARHPKLQFIVHHAGALVPALAHRLTTIYRSEWMAGPDFAPGVGQPYVDQFRRFHVDTVVTTGGTEALQRAVNFFGAENVLFGTDAPFGLDDGRELTDLAIEAVEGLAVLEEERQGIWSGNLVNLLRLDRSPSP